MRHDRRLDYRRLADLLSEAERALDDRARRPFLALRRDLAQAATMLHAYASGQDTAADAEEGARDRRHVPEGEGGEA